MVHFACVSIFPLLEPLKLSTIFYIKLHNMGQSGTLQQSEVMLRDKFSDMGKSLAEGIRVSQSHVKLHFVVLLT